MLLVILTALLLGVTAGPVGAAAAVTNLLQNPGAEAGPGGSDSSGGMPPPGWTVTGDLTTVQYGAAGGFPTTANSASIDGGANFFAGGNSPSSTASQTVDVAGGESGIDANTVSATLSGDLGGYATQDDSMVVVATYLSATGASLGSLTIGPVTQADRNGQTTLLPRSASGAVPAGTRSIQVVMTATRQEGTYNDGYADNLSLSLGSGSTTTTTSTPPPPPVLGSTENVKLVSGKVFIKLPPSATTGRASESLSKGAAFVPLTQARQIPVGSILDTRSGTVGLTAATPSAGKFYTGNFTAGIFELLQNRSQKGLTQLTLMDTLSRKTACVSVGKQASAAKQRVSNKVLGLLKSTDNGKFTTRGNYSAATVRGTAYSVADTCAGTLTTVTRGSVVVDYFRRHKMIVVGAGHAFLAKASGGSSVVTSIGKQAVAAARGLASVL